MTNFYNKCKDLFKKNKYFTPLDFKIMGILTLIFTIMVFFRLGNTYAPESTYTTSYENRDIIIDFGDYISIEKLHIYLGNLDNRKLSLSAFNEVTHSWEIINSDINVSSVFQWNDVNIYYKLRYLGIVSTDEEAIFNEFVFTGPEGIITPVNTSDYPTLFDEQEKFHKSIEKTYMDGTMFDEIYHGRTGYEFVHRLPTYETTHPQFGKCLIAIGILLFGMTPFGWRFMVAIFGILFIPLMYAFAKALFKDTFVATCVGIFITFDCMHYTLSRISTIDIFVAFFIILSYYYMYQYIINDSDYRNNNNGFEKFPPKSVYLPLGLCGIFMGLAISTKLTGVYAGVGLAVILFIHLIKYPPKKQTFRLFLFCFLFFIVLPVIMYILAYIPTVEKYAQMGYTDKTITWNENGLSIGYGYTGLLARTARNTNYMITYHKNLVAEHYYSTPWYEWPIMWMPLLAANDIYSYPDIVSSVSYIGNPLVWWTGIPCVIYTFAQAIIGIFNSRKVLSEQKRARYLQAQFLIIAYLASYIPWFAVSRITFIYHYLPCALFTIIMMGYTIRDIISAKQNYKTAVATYLALTIIMFFIFFPVISGLPVSKEWGLHLRWLPDWILVL